MDLLSTPREREIARRDRARRHSTSMELADQPNLAPARDRGQRQKKKKNRERRSESSDLLSTPRERDRWKGTGHGVTRRLWRSPIGPI